MEIRAKTIDGINGYIHLLMNEGGLSYGKEAPITNHQIQRLPSSLMNSLQSKEDVEILQIHDMEKLGVKDDFNYDHVNVKVIIYDLFCQFSCLFHKQYHFVSTSS